MCALKNIVNPKVIKRVAVNISDAIIILEFNQIIKFYAKMNNAPEMWNAPKMIINQSKLICLKTSNNWVLEHKLKLLISNNNRKLLIEDNEELLAVLVRSIWIHKSSHFLKVYFARLTVTKQWQKRILITTR